ncbi:hypothetical protein BMS3Abin17_00322 [archaeon BMS3Abin17]|nr:hypothetical protein BMS3Abin17_00322 [archaeon BMS3Abin17]HDZ61315.1 hypothetical protein [Candidatus Pacearchaeota archaeon]
MDKVNSQEYFFKYAFPCANVLVENNKLDKKEFEKFKELFISGRVPSKEELESVFVAAFRRIKKLAERMGRNHWDLEVMKEYWHKNHNEVIDGGEGNYAPAPETFKDFCKVHKAEIIEKKDKMLVVRYDDKERAVFDTLVPDAKIGDIVRIHHAYAIEIAP